MARHYAIKAEDGGVVSSWSAGSSWESARLARVRALQDAAPGVYRLRVSRVHGRLVISLGARVRSAEHEISRLRALAARNAGTACTSAPGIAGYQEAARASAAAAGNRRNETRRLADWLVKTQV